MENTVKNTSRELIERDMGLAQLDYTNYLLNRFDSALVIEVKRGERLFTSTAVAIGRNMLLTAAHSVDCLIEARVIVGNVYDQNSTSIKVKKCIVHPGYNPGKSLYENDIAIVILEHNLPGHIKCEAIDEEVNLYNGEMLERFGFGGRDNLNIRTWVKPRFEMCTFSQKNFILKDQDSVIGDSGGPVFKNVGGEFKLIGIHSTLEGADKTYIVNVMKYVDWIEANRSLKVIN